jgi:hypothetical protein
VCNVPPPLRCEPLRTTAYIDCTASIFSLIVDSSLPAYRSRNRGSCFQQALGTIRASCVSRGVVNVNTSGICVAHCLPLVAPCHKRNACRVQQDPLNEETTEECPMSWETRGAMLQATRSRIRDPMRSLNFPIYLRIQPALGPWVYSASNRNEYQNLKNMFLGSRERPVRRTDNLAAICELIV